MTAVIQRIQAKEPVFQDKGTVVAVEGEDVVVRTDDGSYHARQAVSCLVAPEVGDDVLIGGRPSGDLHVLAILERDGTAATRLNARGDVTLQIANGAFTVAASEGVNIISSHDVQVTSTTGLKLRAPEGQVFFDTMTYLGQKVFAEVAQAKLFAGALDTVADRVIQRVKRAYRFVEELEQLRAQYLDYSAQKNLRLRAHNALVSAHELFKVDADQIHLG